MKTVTVCKSKSDFMEAIVSPMHLEWDWLDRLDRLERFS